MKFSLSVKQVSSILALSSVVALSACAAPSETAGTSTSAIPVQTVKPAQGDEFVNFSQWKEVDGFIDHMVEQYGFDKKELQDVLNKTQYVDSAIQLMKPAPPGKPKNWGAYRSRFVEPVRIESGVAFWNRYADALTRAEAQYGVPPEIVVAILGVETLYGRNTGNFRVMDAVTTLAFSYPNTPNRNARMAYFRGELESTLLFARESRIDPFSLRGSYAGAIGWPQFMPSSIRQFAVDFDCDGQIDLRNSPVDAIGSVAKFLSLHDWHKGEPIVFPATVDMTGNWQRFIGQGLEAKFSVDELQAAGVTPLITPPAGMLFGLVDLQNGAEPSEYWLGAANFFAITQYNRSFFYAMSVNDLSRAVRTAHDY